VIFPGQRLDVDAHGILVVRHGSDNSEASP
jgi:hypothetical protein